MNLFDKHIIFLFTYCVNRLYLNLQIYGFTDYALTERSLLFSGFPRRLRLTIRRRMIRLTIHRLMIRRKKTRSLRLRQR